MQTVLSMVGIGEAETLSQLPTETGFQMVTSGTVAAVALPLPLESSMSKVDHHRHVIECAQLGGFLPASYLQTRSRPEIETYCVDNADILIEAIGHARGMVEIAFRLENPVLKDNSQSYQGSRYLRQRAKALRMAESRILRALDIEAHLKANVSGSAVKVKTISETSQETVGAVLMQRAAASDVATALENFLAQKAVDAQGLQGRHFILGPLPSYSFHSVIIDASTGAIQ